MLVKLNKVLYGLREAPKIWYDTIRAFLILRGFTNSTLNDCLFYKRYLNGSSIDVLIHVDDGKVTTDTPDKAINMLRALEEKIKVLKVTQGNKHNYLSMVFEYNRERKTVRITMPKYAEKIVDSYKAPTGSRVTSHHTPTLFKVMETEKLARDDQERFHSMVMRIMFYVVRVHPDILCAVNYLSTRTRLGTANTEDQE